MYKLNTEVQQFTVDFRAVKKQFSFLEISLVYSKSDQHSTTFVSYNIELASAKIKSLKLQNVLNIYSAFNHV